MESVWGQEPFLFYYLYGHQLSTWKSETSLERSRQKSKVELILLWVMTTQSQDRTETPSVGHQPDLVSAF